MKIQWIVGVTDESAYRAVVEKYQGHSIVKKRVSRNIDRKDLDVSLPAIWKVLVGCLLTTQQRVGVDSHVDRFIKADGPLFSYDLFMEADDPAQFARSHLAASRLRRTENIASEVAHAVTVFKGDVPLKLTAGIAEIYERADPKMEREVARLIQEHFKGFGPKQSRNLLQWLGLTQYEIPIDSRVVKVLKELHFPVPLSSAALSDEDYYCFILDGLMEVLGRIDVKPCVFDACAFASFEK